MDRCCALARRFADGLAAGDAEILNDVTLDQVLVRFDTDAHTTDMLALVQWEGTLWTSAMARTRSCSPSLTTSRPAEPGTAPSARGSRKLAPPL